MESNDPDAIRQDIDQTRERLGDTVEALAYKTDVAARAKDAVSDGVDAAKGAAAKALEAARSTVAGVGARIPSSHDAKAGVREAGSLAARNPLGLAIGSAAVGFLIGLILPVSTAARDRSGPCEQIAEEAGAIANSVGGAPGQG